MVMAQGSNDPDPGYQLQFMIGTKFYIVVASQTGVEATTSPPVRYGL
jgi:hypothetical protein